MSTKDIKYSRHIMERSHYVFIDRVCVKSRSNDVPEIEEAIKDALLTNKSIAVQEGDKLNVYVNDEGLSYYKKWINEMEDKEANSHLVQAFKDKSISVITNTHESGYSFG